MMSAQHRLGLFGRQRIACCRQDVLETTQSCNTRVPPSSVTAGSGPEARPHLQVRTDTPQEGKPNGCCSDKQILSGCAAFVDLHCLAAVLGLRPLQFPEAQEQDSQLICARALPAPAANA